MKRLPFLTVPVLFFILAPHAFAHTSVNISGNGEGSHTSVKVHTNTGGNYINGQEVSGSNGSSSTKVTVNGKTYVDETTTGAGETNVSVTAEGGKEPEVTYEVKKQSSGEDTSAADVLSDQVKKEIEDEKNAQAEKVKQAVEKQIQENASFFSQIEAFFDSILSFFSRK